MANVRIHVSLLFVFGCIGSHNCIIVNFHCYMYTQRCEGIIMCANVNKKVLACFLFETSPTYSW